MKSKLAQVSLLISGVVLSTFAFEPAFPANEETEPAGDIATKDESDISSSEKTEITRQRSEILSEATAAIEETKAAIDLLDEDNVSDAIAALEKATGKLEIILAREPDLALAPTNVSIIRSNLSASIDDIKLISERAEDALEDGRIQDARRLLAPLASELVISTTNIPLATYPDAIKLAVVHIDEDETDVAKQVLQRALGTLVVTDTIIPLPVLNAEELLAEAEGLATEEDLSQADKDKLEGLVEDIRSELRLAESLGYGSESDFKPFYADLEKLKNPASSDNEKVGMFERLKRFLKNTRDSAQHS